MILVWIFTLHLIADFYLQSREMGTKKSTNIMYLIDHLSILALVFSIGLFPVIDVITAVKFIAVNTLIHGIIDWNIWKAYKISVYKRLKIVDATTFKYYEDHWFYSTIGTDHYLHAVTIIILAYYFRIL